MNWFLLLQCGFFQSLLIPLWSPLAQTFPKLTCCLDNLHRNLDKWKVLRDGGALPGPDGECGSNAYLPRVPSVPAGDFSTSSSSCSEESGSDHE